MLAAVSFYHDDFYLQFVTQRSPSHTPRDRVKDWWTEGPTDGRAEALDGDVTS